VVTRLVSTTQKRQRSALADGYSTLVDGPGEPYESRKDLGGDPVALIDPRATVLLRLIHATDLHIIDAGSPARPDWVEARAAIDPRYRPLMHMARPHDVLSNWGAVAFADAMASNGRDFADLAIFTGDNIDNAQRNELDAFLAIADGGSFEFSYDGPQRTGWATNPLAIDMFTDDLWPFWLPEGGAPDRWATRHGFPLVPGLLDASGDGVQCGGIDMTWLGVVGNHDLLRQGTSLTTPGIEAVAVGDWRALGSPIGFDPVDPAATYLAAPDPFTEGQPRFPVSPLATRRAISRSEFVSAHIESGFHGFKKPDEADYVYDTEHIRVIVLDTNHPTGHYQGSVGLAQLAWLDARLAEAHDRPVVVASHHGAAAIDNTYANPDPTDRRLGDDLETVLLRYGNVVAWLVGHKHVHRIRPILGRDGRPGIWEITTSSVIDWPCQVRAVEIVAGVDGSIGIRTEVLDHDSVVPSIDRLDAAGLAAWHREIAFNTDRVYSGRHRDGYPTDRNTVLARPSSPDSVGDPH
jgi:metallophosphoesterase (TIGR03767 family)